MPADILRNFGYLIIQQMLLKALFGMHFMASRLSRWAEMTDYIVVVTYKQVTYKTKLLKHGGAGQ